MCLCERERERERESTPQVSISLPPLPYILFISSSFSHSDCIHFSLLFVSISSLLLRRLFFSIRCHFHRFLQSQFLILPSFFRPSRFAYLAYHQLIFVHFLSILFSLQNQIFQDFFSVFAFPKNILLAARLAARLAAKASCHPACHTKG